MKTYKGLINELKDNQVFVYGANFEARHGAGSAKKALEFGAKYGKLGAVGRTYSIITKDLKKKTHPSVDSWFIMEQIKELYEFAKKYSHLDFLIAYSGTGTNLNGYSNKEMAEMFSMSNIPDNIVFEEEFYKLMTIV